MEDSTNYVKLAMDASNGAFAWFFFGVMDFHAKDTMFNGLHVRRCHVDPHKHAREYLVDNHPEVLECDKLRALARHIGGHAL